MPVQCIHNVDQKVHQKQIKGYIDNSFRQTNSFKKPSTEVLEIV